MGTIKRDTQIRAIKNPPRITRTRAPAIYFLDLEAQNTAGPTPRARTQTPYRPTPTSLGCKFRLTRPPQGSGVSSVSPDPLEARAQNTASPDSLGLGRKLRHARSPPGLGRQIDQGKASDARRPYPRRDRRSNFCVTAGHGGDYSNHPGHCGLTSFTVVYCLTVKEEWGRLISITICCLLPLLTGQAAASPIRPPRLPQGSVTLHRNSHAVNYPSRTRWTGFNRVGTVASSFNRGNLLM